MNAPSLDLRHGVILAPYTTYKIGGPADFFYDARSSHELAAAIQWARREGVPYFLFGCGANILFTDKGFRGLVIRNRATKSEFSDTRVTAESGAIIADLIAASVEKGLSGLEHFAGIPSTVGGALWQNLHFLSPDRSRTVFIAEVVDSARILTEDGHETAVEPDYFQFAYDYSILHDRQDVVLSATFRLTPKDKQEIAAVAESNVAWRRERHPDWRELPSCGSVFKQVDGVGAGRYIDQAGLKGVIIGHAQISPKHANFFVNLGGAKAQDILDLIALAKMEVKRKLGIILETEISVVGER